MNEHEYYQSDRYPPPVGCYFCGRQRENHFASSSRAPETQSIPIKMTVEPPAENYGEGRIVRYADGTAVEDEPTSTLDGYLMKHPKAARQAEKWAKRHVSRKELKRRLREVLEERNNLKDELDSQLDERNRFCRERNQFLAERDTARHWADRWRNRAWQSNAATSPFPWEPKRTLGDNVRGAAQ